MTTALKLYEYADALAALLSGLYDAEGEITPEIEAALEQAEGEFDQKAERVALFIRELQSNAKAVKEESQRLSSRASQYERTAEGLKRYLQAQMERVEITKVEGKLVTVRLQKSPPSVFTTLPDDEIRHLPAHYVTHVPEAWRLNAKAVIEAHRAGAELPVGVGVTQSLHLRIN